MTPFEEQVEKYFADKGWKSLHKGWPDFVFFKKDEGGKISEVFAVEVKREGDFFRGDQEEMLAVLSQVLPTFVAKEGIGWGSKSMPFKFLYFDRFSDKVVSEETAKCLSE